MLSYDGYGIMSVADRGRSCPPWGLASNERIAPLSLRLDANELDSEMPAVQAMRCISNEVVLP